MPCMLVIKPRRLQAGHTRTLHGISNHAYSYHENRTRRHVACAHADPLYSICVLTHAQTYRVVTKYTFHNRALNAA